MGAVTADSKAVGSYSRSWWAARGAAQPWDGDWAAEIVRCALMGDFFSFSRNHLWEIFRLCVYIEIIYGRFIGELRVIWTVLNLNRTVVD